MGNKVDLESHNQERKEKYFRVVRNYKAERSKSET